MGPSHLERRVFRRGDNVLAYWVDRAEGFDVRYGVGLPARVDKVVVDPRRGRAKALIIRTAYLHRRRLIPVEAVVAVEPFARRLEVERARPPFVARACRSVARLVAWSAPRVRQLAILTYGIARRLARGAAAAWAWLSPRVQTRARASAAWLGPRLAAATRSTWTHSVSGARSLAVHARGAVAYLGPRLSSGVRTVSMQVVAAGYLGLLGLVAAAAWVSPRVRASAHAVASTTITLGVAAAGAVHLIGTRLSNHVR
jgi:hypothetical protein